MPMTDVSTLGARVREARRSYGITQVEFARRVGVSQPTIGYVERGSNPRASTYERILTVLKDLESADHDAAQ